jgi:hypothetical protein
MCVNCFFYLIFYYQKQQKAFIAETVDIEQCIDLYRHAVELALNVSIHAHKL